MAGNESTNPRRPRPAPFLIAAVCASAAAAIALTVDVASPDFAIPAALSGAGRAVCALLWVFWFVTYVADRIMRAYGPDSAAYVAGFVDGVARRFPDEDRVSYK